MATENCHCGGKQTEILISEVSQTNEVSISVSERLSFSSYTFSNVVGAPVTDRKKQAYTISIHFALKCVVMLFKMAALLAY